MLAMNLARGMTVQQAVRDVGIAEVTAYRRLKEPEFLQRIADLRRGMLEGACARVTASTRELVDVILCLALDESQQPITRLKAAVDGLKVGASLRWEMESARRLGRIEQALGINSPLEVQVPQGAAEAGELEQRVEAGE